MDWIGYHWDNVKEFRVHYKNAKKHNKLAKKYNKLYMQGQSPLFHYTSPKNEYIDFQEVNIPKYNFVPSFEGMEEKWYF